MGTCVNKRIYIAMRAEVGKHYDVLLCSARSTGLHPRANSKSLRIAFGIVFFCALGAAQSTPQKQSSSTAAGKADATPVFHASTSVVTVNVVATDSYRQPVGGLEAKDFTLLEDGVPQQIRFFEAHSSGANKADVPEVKLPPNQFTNFHNRNSGSVINIVLFDMLNTPMMDQVFARDQLKLFLKSLPAGEPIALFTLGTRLRMVQGFTSDVNALLAAANALHPGMTPFAHSTERDLLDARTRDRSGPAQGNTTATIFERALAEEDALRTGYRVGVTVDAIGAISRAVSGYSGRKNLLWLSAGFPLYVGPDLNSKDPLENIENYQEQVSRLGIALASSQMAVYPIDVRGLMTQGFDPSESVLRPDSPVVPNPLMPDFSQLWSTQETMKEIAEQTGGEAFYNTNGIEQAMRRSVERGSHYYTLAYVPKNRDWNGKYRSIKVKVSNPALKLQYRRGYLALPEHGLSGERPLHLLAMAMEPGFPDSTMLFMKVQALPPDDGHAAVRIDYGVFPSQLSYLDVPDKGKRATLQFVIVVWDKNGAQQAMRAQGVEVPLSAETMHVAVGSHEEVRLKPGEYVLKVGAIDVASQKIGTVEIPLVVPATATTSGLVERPK